MDIYERIEALMKCVNVERRTLCDDTGISYSTFTSMINRKSKNLSLDTVKKIAEYFNIPSDYLLSIGVFGNWDQILKYWPVVEEYIDYAFNKSNLSFLNFDIRNVTLIEKIRIIHGLFANIEISEEKKTMDFYFNIDDNSSKPKFDSGIKSNKNYGLSSSEQSLIEKYRAVDNRSKNMIELVINNEYSRLNNKEKSDIEFGKELELKKLDDIHNKAKSQLEEKYASADPKKISVPSFYNKKNA